MNANEVLKHVDHTLLTQTATWEEIKAICDDAVKYGIISSVGGLSDALLSLREMINDKKSSEQKEK